MDQKKYNQIKKIVSTAESTLGVDQSSAKMKQRRVEEGVSLPTVREI
jgi:hypothetical protein